MACQEGTWEARSVWRKTVYLNACPCINKNPHKEIKPISGTLGRKQHAEAALMLLPSRGCPAFCNHRSGTPRVGRCITCLPRWALLLRDRPHSQPLESKNGTGATRRDPLCHLLYPHARNGHVRVGTSRHDLLVERKVS